MEKQIWLFFIILLSIPALLCGQRSMTVAVLDFEGRGISQFEAATLTDRLISELGNTEAVTLVERKQLERILEEQGLQQSGCTSQECVAEVGQLLGVQYMISGSINKLGETFTIDAKMFSVETGANIRTVSKTHRGRIDELIAQMEVIAWELVGLDERKQETVAVLDFEGRGISQTEAATLTDRFTTALGNTEAVLLVARQEMNEILNEQGYQQEGCTSVECAAEVGALIGVKNIVQGSVGKIGETYTIDAQMINVGTGATIKTVSQTYTGRIDGLITEIEIMAWEIVNMDPPSELIMRQRSGIPTTTGLPKPRTRLGAAARSIVLPGWGQLYSSRKIAGYGILATEIALGGMLYASFDEYNKAEEDYIKYKNRYDTESDPDKVVEYRQRSQEEHDLMEQANGNMVVYGAALGVVWFVNALHAYISGPVEMADINSKPFDLVYNNKTNQIQLRWSIALD